MKTMDELRIGDRVKVGYPAQFSDVYFFSHKHKEQKAQFVRLQTSGGALSLTLSPQHLVYANGARMRAGSVRVGDKLSVGENGEIEVVKSVRKVEGVGLHNPHTLHGDIVVDGVLASTYTAAVHPRLASLLLAPFRAVFYLAGAHDAVQNLNRAVLRTLDVVVWGRADM